MTRGWLWWKRVAHVRRESIARPWKFAGTDGDVGPVNVRLALIDAESNAFRSIAKQRREDNWHRPSAMPAARVVRR